jgi:hypothetical protein
MFAGLFCSNFWSLIFTTFAFYHSCY